MTRMVVQGQLVELAICFSDQKDCEELSHLFIRQKPNEIILRQKSFFNNYEPKNSIYDIYTRQWPNALLSDLINNCSK